jgi:hypothetical protein
MGGVVGLSGPGGYMRKRTHLVKVKFHEVGSAPPPWVWWAAQAVVAIQYLKLLVSMGCASSSGNGEPKTTF